MPRQNEIKFSLNTHSSQRPGPRPSWSASASISSHPWLTLTATPCSRRQYRCSEKVGPCLGHNERPSSGWRLHPLTLGFLEPHQPYQLLHGLKHYTGLRKRSRLYTWLSYGVLTVMRVILAGNFVARVSEPFTCKRRREYSQHRVHHG